MLSNLNFENRMDQLSALGILPWPKYGKIKIKFSGEFYNTFTMIWNDSFLKLKMKFDERLQVVSGVVLMIIHPDLDKNDIFELSHVCLLFLNKFYL